MPTITQREPEQLSLFDSVLYGESREKAQPQAVITLPVRVTAAPTVQKPAKVKVPAKPTTAKQRMAAISEEPAYAAFATKLERAVAQKDFQSLLVDSGVEIFNINNERQIYNRYSNQSRYAAWQCTAKDRLAFTEKDWEARDRAVTFYTKGDDHRYRENYTTTIEINFAYVSEKTAELMVTPVTIDLTVIFSNVDNEHSIGLVDAITAGKTYIPVKFIKDLCFIQPEGKLHQIILQTRPWIKDWLLQNPLFNLKRYIAAPWLETLHKAGYDAVARRFLSMHVDDKAIDNFNRLCGPGTKPKDIFKCSKTVYTVLKEEIDLQVWDTIRRLDKKGQITDDSIRIIYQMGLQPKQLELVNSILGQTYHDKPVFTVESLVNYLNRLDMYEAVSTSEALPLLNDYLHMCHSLTMPPRIDGDSLKREHDIAARLVRQQRDQKMAEMMRERKEREQREIEEGNSRMKKAEYHENIYFVRPIVDYDDLLDEAFQQDNCVASYAGRIASGQSRIFTMRETAHPERSLVTIELSPDCKTIRQKYLAHNHRIINKSINDFIDRWHKQLLAA